jgi:hypothetical protein
VGVLLAGEAVAVPVEVVGVLLAGEAAEEEVEQPQLAVLSLHLIIYLLVAWEDCLVQEPCWVSQKKNPHNHLYLPHSHLFQVLVVLWLASKMSVVTGTRIFLGSC